MEASSRKLRRFGLKKINNVCNFFNDDGIDVAEILIELPRLILRRNESPQDFKWGAKGRRSAINVSPFPSLSPHGSSLSSSHFPLYHVLILSHPSCFDEKTTPQFALNESDANSTNSSKKKYSKRKREEEFLQQEKSMFTKKPQVLIQKLDEEKLNYKQQMKNPNLESSRKTSKNHQLLPSLSMSEELFPSYKGGLDCVGSSEQVHEQHQLQQQPLIVDQKAYRTDSYDVRYGGIESKQLISQSFCLIPDLNCPAPAPAPAEEYEV